MQESWTIAELAELAAETLAATESDEPSTGPVRADGRVRDVPNERLVRWYAAVGLVDPPLSRRGRVARYGRRHLLQLVAVKRRQAEGQSLAEIQASWRGRPTKLRARSPASRTWHPHRACSRRLRPGSGHARRHSGTRLPGRSTEGRIRPTGRSA